MILKDAHLDGVFYVCPAYNEAILSGAKIGKLAVDKPSYVSLGSPQAVESYASRMG